MDWIEKRYIKMSFGSLTLILASVGLVSGQL